MIAPPAVERYRENQRQIAEEAALKKMLEFLNSAASRARRLKARRSVL